MQVKFYDTVDDKLFKYAVIAARHDGKWVFCKHKKRSTYECPGGHREPGEAIEETARRELWEETGAVKFDITPVCAYSFSDYGMLYFAEIYEFGEMPELEIERIELFDSLPDNWTYPLIQPKLIDKVCEFLNSDKE